MITKKRLRIFLFVVVATLMFFGYDYPAFFLGAISLLLFRSFEIVFLAVLADLIFAKSPFYILTPIAILVVFIGEFLRKRIFYDVWEK